MSEPVPPPYLGEGCVTPFPRSEIVRRELWSLVQATVFRWSPRQLHGFRARLLRWFGADIPEPGQVVIFPSAQIFMPWKLTLAPRSMIGRGVNVYNPGAVELRYGANVSQNCHLCSGSHDYRRWSMPLVVGPVIIGTNAWLAADVFVGPGVTVGELCVVGARSVVVKDLPPRTVCAGNPCRAIAAREDPAR